MRLLQFSFFFSAPIPLISRSKRGKEDNTPKPWRNRQTFENLQTLRRGFGNRSKLCKGLGDKAPGSKALHSEGNTDSQTMDRKVKMLVQ